MKDKRTIKVHYLPNGEKMYEFSDGSLSYCDADGKWRPVKKEARAA